MNLRQEVGPIDFGMESRIQSILSSPKLTEFLGKKQVEVVEGEGGSFLFIDGAGFFEGGQISADLQEVINELRARGADVVILTSNNPDKLETLEIRDQILKENKLMDEDGTLSSRVIVCIYNNKKNDGKREVSCETGSAFTGIITSSTTDEATDQIVGGILDGNIDAGFVNAYRGFDRIFDQRDARATQQALPQPTSTSAPLENVAPVVNQEIKPSFQDFVETNKTPLKWGAGVSIMLAFVGLDHVLARPIREFVRTIERSRAQAKAAYRELDERRSLGISAVQSIISGYEASYPDKAAEARADQQIILAELESLASDYKSLVSEKVGFFGAISQSGKDRLSEVKDEAQELRSRSINLVRQIEEQMKLAEDLRAREQAARSNVDTVKGLIKDKDGLEDWYDQQRQSFAKILPSKDQALSGIYSTFASAEKDAYYQPEFALRGSDVAVQLVETIKHFKQAVDTLTHAFNTSLSLARDSEPHLAKWPGEAIEILELISSGTILLNEAKSGVSVEEKFDEVISKSQAAEKEFIEAKEFATVTASVLQLRDANAGEISKIVAEDFKEAHIQAYKDRMKQSLAKANTLASQGNWREAQEQLGIFRVSTNESLAEMERLQNLHEQNNTDLRNLATEVAKNQQRYSKDTTDAWNDLRTNFTSANYDETQEIWKELRKIDSFSMTPLATANLESHHVDIGKTLKELTDDRTDENDIVSRAATANSMEVQKFDQASDLIREMEQRLMRAVHMMDELENRQKLANKAKAEYQAASVNAESLLGLAKKSIANPELNRLVDAVVDQQIERANSFVELAKKAGAASIYVAALEASSRAADLSIRSRQSAEEQIEILKDLYQKLDVDNKNVSAKAQSVMQSVQRESTAVVTSTTSTAYRDLEQALAAIVVAENGLAVKQDRTLAAAIEDILLKLEDIDGQARDLQSNLENDQESYQELLDELSSAIDSASSAIRSAASRCSDSDAGSAGSNSLSSAKSSLPDMLQKGAKRSDIESSIRSAKSAESYAETAETQANRAIKEAEDAREAAERARLQKIRDDEKAAQDARDKAAEDARDRANERTRTFSSPGNQSNKTF